MNKLILVPLMIVVLVIALVGCANPPPAPVPTHAPTPTAAPLPTTAPSTTPTTSSPSSTTSPVATTAPASTAPRKVIELSFNMPVPSNHLRWTTLVKPWIDELEKATNGGIKVTPYFAGALASMATNIDAVVSGIADMVEGNTKETGRFPMMEMMALQLWSPDSELNSKALWRTIQTIPAMQNEWKGMKVLSVANWMPVHINSHFPIRTADDIKGKKINAIGGNKPDVMKAFGAIPTSIGTADLYMAIQKGIVDGGMIGPEPVWSRKWGEFWKYTADYNFGGDVFYFVMNQKTFDRLPDDYKKIIDSMSGEPLVLKYGREAMANHDKALRLLKENLGHTYINLSDEETARWLQICLPPSMQYLNELEAKGLPGRQAAAAIMEYMPVKISLD